MIPDSAYEIVPFATDTSSLVYEPEGKYYSNIENYYTPGMQPLENIGMTRMPIKMFVIDSEEARFVNVSKTWNIIKTNII